MEKKIPIFRFLVEKLKENGTETRIWHIEHPRHKYCLGQVEIHSLKSSEHFVERKIPIFRIFDWKPNKMGPRQRILWLIEHTRHKYCLRQVKNTHQRDSDNFRTEHLPICF
jgi:hypothetical protein